MAADTGAAGPALGDAARRRRHGGQRLGLQFLADMLGPAGRAARGHRDHGAGRRLPRRPRGRRLPVSRRPRRRPGAASAASSRRWRTRTATASSPAGSTRSAGSARPGSVGRSAAQPSGTSQLIHHASHPDQNLLHPVGRRGPAGDRPWRRCARAGRRHAERAGADRRSRDRRDRPSVPPPVATFLLTSETEPEAIIDHAGATAPTRCSWSTGSRRGLPAPAGGSAGGQAGPGDPCGRRPARSPRRARCGRLGRRAAPGFRAAGRGRSRILGGTGQTHDWALSRQIVEAVACPVFLAGGLRPGQRRPGDRHRAPVRGRPLHRGAQRRPARPPPSSPRSSPRSQAA